MGGILKGNTTIGNGLSSKRDSAYDGAVAIPRASKIYGNAKVPKQAVSKKVLASSSTNLKDIMLEQHKKVKIRLDKAGSSSRARLGERMGLPKAKKASKSGKPSAAFVDAFGGKGVVGTRYVWLLSN